MHTIAFLLFLFLFLTQSVFAQPGVTLGDGQGSGGDVTAYSTDNFAVSGADVLLLACVYNVQGAGSQVTTAVTWNTSESFTHLVTQGTEPDDAGNISLWYLINPTQTTENVDISITDLSTSTVSVVIVTGASSDAPTLTNTGLLADPTSADLTTTVDDTLLFACAGNGESAGTFTYGAGQSELSLVQEPAASGITHTLSTEVKVTAGAETLVVDSVENNASRLVVTGIEPAEVVGVARRRRAPWSFR